MPQVHEDYDCTLNQTNIGSNNNKFYIIQLLQDGERFVCWNRWGRVVRGTSRPWPTSSLLLSACPLLPRASTKYPCPKATAADLPLLPPGPGPGTAEATACLWWAVWWAHS